MSDTIDRDALRVKYRAERDKRLRADGNEQYVEPTGQFARYLDDPYVAPEPRAPLFDEVTVAFIGGGFSGLVTGAKLKQAGIDDVRIHDIRRSFGLRIARTAGLHVASKLCRSLEQEIVAIFERRSLDVVRIARTDHCSIAPSGPKIPLDVRRGLDVAKRLELAHLVEVVDVHVV